MYSSKEYQQVAKNNIDYLDALLKNSKGKKLNILKRNFKKSTILEKNFWECFV
jgi:thiaminase